MGRRTYNLNSETVTARFTAEQLTDANLANGSIYWHENQSALYVYVDDILGHRRVALAEDYHFSLILSPVLDLTTVTVGDTLSYTDESIEELDWVVGQRIVFQHDVNDRLVGTVSAYDSDAGSISFVVDSKTGTGSFAQWSGSFIGDAAIDGRLVVPIIGTFANFTALDGATTLNPNVGDLAFVEAPQGTGTVFGVRIPGWLAGGTYYPSGYYMYGSTVDPDNNSRWVYSNQAIVDSIETSIGRLIPTGGAEGQVLTRGSGATDYIWEPPPGDGEDGASLVGFIARYRGSDGIVDSTPQAGDVTILQARAEQADGTVIDAGSTVEVQAGQQGFTPTLSAVVTPTATGESVQLRQTVDGTTTDVTGGVITLDDGDDGQSLRVVFARDASGTDASLTHADGLNFVAFQEFTTTPPAGFPTSGYVPLTGMAVVQAEGITEFSNTVTYNAGHVVWRSETSLNAGGTSIPAMSFYETNIDGVTGNNPVARRTTGSWTYLGSAPLSTVVRAEKTGATVTLWSNTGGASDLTTSVTITELTSTQTNNFQTAFNHTSLTNNPHNVTAAQIGAVEAGGIIPNWKEASIFMDASNNQQVSRRVAYTRFHLESTGLTIEASGGLNSVVTITATTADAKAFLADAVNGSTGLNNAGDQVRWASFARTQNEERITCFFPLTETVDATSTADQVVTGTMSVYYNRDDDMLINTIPAFGATACFGFEMNNVSEIIFRSDIDHINPGATVNLVLEDDPGNTLHFRWPAASVFEAAGLTANANGRFTPPVGWIIETQDTLVRWLVTTAVEVTPQSGNPDNSPTAFRKVRDRPYNGDLTSSTADGLTERVPSVNAVHDAITAITLSSLGGVSTMDPRITNITNNGSTFTATRQDGNSISWTVGSGNGPGGGGAVQLDDTEARPVPVGGIAIIDDVEQYYNISSMIQTVTTDGDSVTGFTDTAVWVQVGDGDTHEGGAVQLTNIAQTIIPGGIAIRTTEIQYYNTGTTSLPATLETDFNVSPWVRVGDGGGAVQLTTENQVVRPGGIAVVSPTEQYYNTGDFAIGTVLGSDFAVSPWVRVGDGQGTVVRPHLRPGQIFDFKLYLEDGQAEPNKINDTSTATLTDYLGKVGLREVGHTGISFDLTDYTITITGIDATEIIDRYNIAQHHYGLVTTPTHNIYGYTRSTPTDTSFEFDMVYAQNITSRDPVTLSDLASVTADNSQLYILSETWQDVRYTQQAANTISGITGHHVGEFTTTPVTIIAAGQTNPQIAIQTDNTFFQIFPTAANGVFNGPVQVREQFFDRRRILANGDIVVRASDFALTTVYGFINENADTVPQGTHMQMAGDTVPTVADAIWTKGPSARHGGQNEITMLPNTAVAYGRLLGLGTGDGNTTRTIPRTQYQIAANNVLVYNFTGPQIANNNVLRFWNLNDTTDIIIRSIDNPNNNIEFNPAGNGSISFNGTMYPLAGTTTALTGITIDQTPVPPDFVTINAAGTQLTIIPIEERHLVNGAATTDKIADGAVTDVKGGRLAETNELNGNSFKLSADATQSGQALTFTTFDNFSTTGVAPGDLFIVRVYNNIGTEIYQNLRFFTTDIVGNFTGTFGVSNSNTLIFHASAQEHVATTALTAASLVTGNSISFQKFDSIALLKGGFDLEEGALFGDREAFVDTKGVFYVNNQSAMGTVASPRGLTYYQEDDDWFLQGQGGQAIISFPS